MKSFIKKKSQPNQAGPHFRTPDHFKGKVVFKNKFIPTKFNPAHFKIQHKG